MKQKNTERYNVNNSLLQAYRGVFLASQSVMISAGAITFDKDPFVNAFISIIALIQLLVGFTVISARAKVVDYYYNDLSEVMPLDKYIHDRKARKDENRLRKIKNISHTRWKIDVFLPLSFASIWIVFIGYQII